MPRLEVARLEVLEVAFAEFQAVLPAREGVHAARVHALQAFALLLAREHVVTRFAHATTEARRVRVAHAYALEVRV